MSAGSLKCSPAMPRVTRTSAQPRGYVQVSFWTSGVYYRSPRYPTSAQEQLAQVHTLNLTMQVRMHLANPNILSYCYHTPYTNDAQIYDVCIPKM